MEVFKVRNSEGLFWEGHGSYKFTEEGKTWKKINHVRSAFTNAYSNMWNDDHRVIGKKLPDYLKDCEIVKFELKEIAAIKI